MQEGSTGVHLFLAAESGGVAWWPAAASPPAPSSSSSLLLLSSLSLSRDSSSSLPAQQSNLRLSMQRLSVPDQVQHMQQAWRILRAWTTRKSFL
jgi:hypothetical protein